MKFKIVVNLTEYSRLEQRSVMKFLMAENCKPCEIYRRIWEVYREAYFSIKMFTNMLNMSLPLQAQVKKKVQGVETH